MVGSGDFPMISKNDPSLSKAVGPSFLLVKKSYFNKNIHLTAILLTNGSLMKVERIAFVVIAVTGEFRRMPGSSGESRRYTTTLVRCAHPSTSTGSMSYCSRQ